MRSPLTRVMPPLSMATSVPVPMAMPTLACASAGASLMPSPAMATTLPCACSLRMTSSFPSGRTSASNSVDAELLGNLRCTVSVIAGEHDDAEALTLSVRAERRERMV